jgi:hypothetical protein
MLSEFMAIIATLSRSAIYAALRTIGRDSQARALTLRMLPPEHRPSMERANRSMIEGEMRTRPGLRKRSVKLSTLRDCQMNF